ncbi:hypothetical protein G9A89_013171 [Geosiphon pyriformis]|nr:hypothetical protein G9A89_013171 [Geosiphon pyriformis]
MLPLEGWSEVFENLDDKSSLFSCLLVSRLWCRIIMPILWRKPFDLVSDIERRIRLYRNLKIPFEKKFDISYIVREDLAKLINTYIKCFSPASKSVLAQKGIDISTPNGHALSFNYPCFIRNLPLDSLIEASSAWISKEEKHDEYFEFAKLLLSRELCKLFLASSSSIYNVSLVYYIPYGHEFHPPNDLLAIHEFPGAKNCLARVKQFKCCLFNEQWKIMDGMSKICRNLEEFDIRCISEPKIHLSDQSEENLSKFILAQKIGMRQFTLNCCGKNCRILKVISNLVNHVETLKHLEFIHASFEKDNFLEIIVACRKLRTLIFRDCQINDTKVLTSPKATCFASLTSLFFVDTFIPPRKVIKMLESCIRLETLQIDLGEEEEYLPQMALNFPPTLRHLTVDAVGVNWMTLEEALINIRAPLVSLRFPAWICRSFTDHHLLVIVKYSKGTLQRLDLHLCMSVQGNISFEAMREARRVIELVTTGGYWAYSRWLHYTLTVPETPANLRKLSENNRRPIARPKLTSRPRAKPTPRTNPHESGATIKLLLSHSGIRQPNIQLMVHSQIPNKTHNQEPALDTSFNTESDSENQSLKMKPLAMAICTRSFTVASYNNWRTGELTSDQPDEATHLSQTVGDDLLPRSSIKGTQKGVIGILNATKAIHTRISGVIKSFSHSNWQNSVESLYEVSAKTSSFTT